MSTSYYRLKEPITSLRLTSGPAWDHLTVFENGAQAGTLVLSKDVGPRVALMFADKQEFTCPAHTHWGGADRGCVVTINDKEMSDDAVVVSQYGEIMTIGKVKSYDGMGKRQT